MDVFLEILEHHRIQLGAFAGALTIMQYFGGLSTCYYVQMDENFRIPNSVFIGNLIVTSLTIIYASLIVDVLLVVVNIAYTLIDLGCVCIYWYNSRNRWEDTYTPLLQALIIILSCYLYRHLDKEDKIPVRFGVLLNIFTMITLLHPSKELEQVIKDRSSPRIGLHLVFTTTMTYALWLLYAVAIRDFWIFLQNLQWFVMCLLQLFLCCAFPQLQRRDYSVGTVSVLTELN